MADDIYSLLMDESEPDAAARAATMADMLRRNRGVGGLALLSGDRVLGRFGEALLGQSGQQEAALAGAGQQRAGNVLRSALAAQQQQTALARAGADAENARLNREQRNELARLGRENALKAAAIQAGDKATQQKLELEGGLRRELMGNPVIKSYQEAAVAFDKMQRAATDTSAAGDLALIFAYMKALDPGSTVREGEFANAQNAAGIPERIRNAWNKGLSGERLSPQQRQEFITSARGQFAAAKERAEALMGGYSGLARDVGAEPSRVVLPGTKVDVDLSAPAKPAAAPRPAGVLPLPAGKDRADVLSKMREGQQYSTRMPDGSVRVVMKKGGKIVKVSQSGGQ